ncbi:MAG: phenylalanine--tRNA ligase subunit beta, partial [Gammaproteobacteria bacterium]
EDQLTGLGLQIETTSEGWNVSIPSFRFDLAIEVDLIEELGRLYGYENLPNTRPQGTVLSADISEETLATHRLQSLLVDRGYQEAITYSFVDPKIQQHLVQQGETAIELANPISADLSIMRISLWPGLVQALVYNLNRQHTRVQLFEVGRVFKGTTDNVEQHRHIGGVLCGSRYPEQWAEKEKPVDFYDAKADVEALLNLGGKKDIKFVAEQHDALHPGQSARIVQDGLPIGWLGALHPRLEKTLGFTGKVYVFELALVPVLAATIPEFSPLSKFPAIRRDIALILDEEISINKIDDCLKAIKSDILNEIQLFDVYSGDGVELGKKSVAVAFTVQHDERTLTDEDMNALMQMITEQLEKEVGATIRS